MYYLGWLITTEKKRNRLQFVAKRSIYPDIYEMQLIKLYKRIEYAENEIGRVDNEYYKSEDLNAEYTS